MCLFVAGVVDVTKVDAAVSGLDQLAAAATATKLADGTPASLATLLRARKRFFGGACVGKGEGSPAGIDKAVYSVRPDFYGAYHVPLFATYEVCEHAALLEAR